MNLVVFIGCAFLAVVSVKPQGPLPSNHEALILSLINELLCSLEFQSPLPNPSVYLALRLSTRHFLAMETAYLVRLRTELHRDLESSLTKHQPVTGLLALYALALRASCTDVSGIMLNQERLVIQLEKQMDQDMKGIFYRQHPLSSYYQYSLGVLALCANGVRVSTDVRNKLVNAVKMVWVDDSIDTLAMVGMALQCLKDSPTVQDGTHLEETLGAIKQKLLDSRRPDGHLGNEFSTGLAVQALLAMGHQLSDCSAPMESMRVDARKGTYHNLMAISRTVPALQRRSYLNIKTAECTEEDDSLSLEPALICKEPPVVNVSLQVEVIPSDGSSSIKTVDVPKGSSLLKALKLLSETQDFKFVVESSLWGPFLSVVNGERGRQSDRSWHLSSDGTSLHQGIGDYKIEKAQKITIKMTSSDDCP